MPSSSCFSPLLGFRLCFMEKNSRDILSACLVAGIPLTLDPKVFVCPTFRFLFLLLALFKAKRLLVSLFYLLLSVRVFLSNPEKALTTFCGKVMLTDVQSLRQNVSLGPSRCWLWFLLPCNSVYMVGQEAGILSQL
jgi:hypothetical protein